MTASLGRILGYDNTTNLVSTACSGASSLQFGYGGHGQRVLKLTTNGSTSWSVYFTGSSDLPIAASTTATGPQWFTGPPDWSPSSPIRPITR